METPSKTVPSVLVVDDNAADQHWCKRILRKTKRFPNVYCARDGVEALRLFQEPSQAAEEFPNVFPPSLILLDINMPRMDGFEFLAHYKELVEAADDTNFPRVVLMVTSSTNPRDVERAKELGIVPRFISKPLTVEQANEIADAFGELPEKTK
tara:strand:- start:51295 stop:51753 length:459 start_codon:yes stop_codon:yes gene_type:complete